MTDEKKVQFKNNEAEQIFFILENNKIQDAQEGTMKFEPLAHPGPPPVV